MNSKQIKQAISRFRSADVSVIKDDAKRAKAQQLQAKQKGFTLLELLVVITLLAVLSVGAMVAYEGIGATAKDTASANNIASAENMIRNFRAVEDRYPNQFDNLANADGIDTDGMAKLRAPETSAFFGQWKVPVAQHTGAAADDSVYAAVSKALLAVGIDEIQSIKSTSTFDVGYVPNLALNESYELTLGQKGSEIELGVDAEFNELPVAALLGLSIVPSAGDGGCAVDGTDISEAFDITSVTVENTRLNLINDGLDDDACSLVIAVGIGKDVPGSTLGSQVAIATAPTATSANINPANHYARYIALFHLGDAADGADIVVDDILPKARLIGVVDTEGRTIDQAIAGANAS